MADRHLVELLGELARIPDDAIPAAVRASVHERVLDIVGLCFAALSVDGDEGVIGYVADQGGAGQAQAIGLGEPVPASSAAFVNGVLAHALDYDDTHLPSIVHPSATVVPAALAAAQLAAADGRALVAGVAVGLETCVRLGMAGYDAAAGQSLYFERGQHATSMCGAIGGAAAAARILGLDAEGAAHAMAIAVSMASGVLEANRTGGTVKRLHCGWAAHAAVTAAELARRGVTGPPTVLEGRFGFFTAFLDGRFDQTAIRDGLGEVWSVPAIHFKPYPANHFTHAGIDAALALRRAGIRPDDIESVHLGVATPTVRTIGEPLDVKRRPVTGYQARFSGPYAFAAAIFGGGGLGVGLDDFTDELAADPQRRALMDRTTVGADPQCDALYPERLPAAVTVVLRDGTERRELVADNRGGPARPLRHDELRRKFRDNASRSLGADDVDRLESTIDRLDHLGQVRDLLRVDATFHPDREV